jgi:sensor histidine kinase regulating citrate/malate metabolism
VVIAKGDEDITIKVADEGGGIARADMWKVQQQGD